MRRVVITGIGVISAVGLNQQHFLASLRSGRCGISTLDGLNEEHGVLRFKNAAQVRGYDPELTFDPKELGFMDRFTQFAMSAAHEAMTSTFDENEVVAVAMLTDGVTRLIDHFGHDWKSVLENLRTGGPSHTIDLVREAERTRQGAYRKPHDDATALLITLRHTS